MKPILPRLLPLATGLMVVLLGAKIYAIGETVSSGRSPVMGGLVDRAEAVPAAVVPTEKPTVSADGSAGVHNACAHDTACQGGEPPPVPEDRTAATLRDLAQREHALEGQEADMAERRRVMDAANVALQQRMAALSMSQTTLEAHEQRQQQLSDADSERLVKIYEAMRPVDAAAIFNILDLRLSVRLLSQMTPRRASAIMAVMSPQRAILATQIMVTSHALPHPVVAQAG